MTSFAFQSKLHGSIQMQHIGLISLAPFIAIMYWYQYIANTFPNIQLISYQGDIYKKYIFALLLGVQTLDEKDDPTLHSRCEMVWVGKKQTNSVKGVLNLEVMMIK